METVIAEKICGVETSLLVLDALSGHVQVGQFATREVVRETHYEIVRQHCQGTQVGRTTRVSHGIKGIQGICSVFVR